MNRNQNARFESTAPHFDGRTILCEGAASLKMLGTAVNTSTDASFRLKSAASLRNRRAKPQLQQNASAVASSSSSSAAAESSRRVSTDLPGARLEESVSSFDEGEEDTLGDDVDASEVERLYCAGCALTSFVAIRWVFSWPSLCLLDVSNNAIQVLGFNTMWATMGSLKTLFLHNNRIGDLDAIVDPLRLVPSLTHLSVNGNPASMTGARARLIDALPQLKVIDEHVIADIERLSFAPAQPIRHPRFKPFSAATHIGKRLALVPGLHDGNAQAADARLAMYLATQTAAVQPSIEVQRCWRGVATRLAVMSLHTQDSTRFLQRRLRKKASAAGRNPDEAGQARGSAASRAARPGAAAMALAAMGDDPDASVAPGSPMGGMFGVADALMLLRRALLNWLSRERRVESAVTEAGGRSIVIMAEDLPLWCARVKRAARTVAAIHAARAEELKRQQQRDPPSLPTSALDQVRSLADIGTARGSNKNTTRGPGSAPAGASRAGIALSDVMSASESPLSLLKHHPHALVRERVRFPLPALIASQLVLLPEAAEAMASKTRRDVGNMRAFCRSRGIDADDAERVRQEAVRCAERRSDRRREEASSTAAAAAATTSVVSSAAATAPLVRERLTTIVFHDLEVMGRVINCARVHNAMRRNTPKRLVPFYLAEDAERVGAVTVIQAAWRGHATRNGNHPMFRAPASRAQQQLLQHNANARRRERVAEAARTGRLNFTLDPDYRVFRPAMVFYATRLQAHWRGLLGRRRTRFLRQLRDIPLRSARENEPGVAATGCFISASSLAQLLPPVGSGGPIGVSGTFDFSFDQRRASSPPQPQDRLPPGTRNDGHGNRLMALAFPEVAHLRRSLELGSRINRGVVGAATAAAAAVATGTPSRSSSHRPSSAQHADRRPPGASSAVAGSADRPTPAGTDEDAGGAVPRLRGNDSGRTTPVAAMHATTAAVSSPARTGGRPESAASVHAGVKLRADSSATGQSTPPALATTTMTNTATATAVAKERPPTTNRERMPTVRSGVLFAGHREHYASLPVFLRSALPPVRACDAALLLEPIDAVLMDAELLYFASGVSARTQHRQLKAAQQLQAKAQQHARTRSGSKFANMAASVIGGGGAGGSVTPPRRGTLAVPAGADDASMTPGSAALSLPQTPCVSGGVSPAERGLSPPGSIGGRAGGVGLPPSGSAADLAGMSLNDFPHAVPASSSRPGSAGAATQQSPNGGMRSFARITVNASSPTAHHTFAASAAADIGAMPFLAVAPPADLARYGLIAAPKSRAASIFGTSPMVGSPQSAGGRSFEASMAASTGGGGGPPPTSSLGSVGRVAVAATRGRRRQEAREAASRKLAAALTPAQVAVLPPHVGSREERREWIRQRVAENPAGYLALRYESRAEAAARRIAVAALTFDPSDGSCVCFEPRQLLLQRGAVASIAQWWCARAEARRRRRRAAEECSPLTSLGSSTKGTAPSAKPADDAMMTGDPSALVPSASAATMVLAGGSSATTAAASPSSAALGLGGSAQEVAVGDPCAVTRPTPPPPVVIRAGETVPPLTPFAPGVVPTAARRPFSARELRRQVSGADGDAASDAPPLPTASRDACVEQTRHQPARPATARPSTAGCGRPSSSGSDIPEPDVQPALRSARPPSARGGAAANAGASGVVGSWSAPDEARRRRDGIKATRAAAAADLQEQTKAVKHLRATLGKPRAVISQQLVPMELVTTDGEALLSSTGGRTAAAQEHCSLAGKLAAAGVIPPPALVQDEHPPRVALAGARAGSGIVGRPSNGRYHSQPIEHRLEVPVEDAGAGWPVPHHRRGHQHQPHHPGDRAPPADSNASRPASAPRSVVSSTTGGASDSVISVGSRRACGSEGHPASNVVVVEREVDTAVVLAGMAPSEAPPECFAVDTATDDAEGNHHAARAGLSNVRFDANFNGAGSSPKPVSATEVPVGKGEDPVAALRKASRAHLQKFMAAEKAKEDDALRARLEQRNMDNDLQRAAVQARRRRSATQHRANTTLRLARVEPTADTRLLERALATHAKEQRETLRHAQARSAVVGRQAERAAALGARDERIRSKYGGGGAAVVVAEDEDAVCLVLESDAAQQAVALDDHPAPSAGGFGTTASAAGGITQDASADGGGAEAEAAEVKEEQHAATFTPAAGQHQRSKELGFPPPIITPAAVPTKTAAAATAAGSLPAASHATRASVVGGTRVALSTRPTSARGSASQSPRRGRVSIVPPAMPWKAQTTRRKAAGSGSATAKGAASHLDRDQLRQSGDHDAAFGEW